MTLRQQAEFRFGKNIFQTKESNKTRLWSRGRVGTVHVSHWYEQVLFQRATFVLKPTYLPTPKYLRQYSEQPMSVFSDFWPHFLQLHNQSVKTKQCQRSIFLSFILYEQCVNPHLQLYRRTTLGRLYFVYICESRSQSKTAEHFLPKQCIKCAAFTDADVAFLEWLLFVRVCFLRFVHSSSSLSVSCSHLIIIIIIMILFL